ncbi:formin-like protein 3 isoform X1 [Dromaius novaehollandiae]|uniref:formin-like protein 3 isoform X1 n=1 Tax=Dromaius novaehollandiae TaxID=8790 RepID=UPI00311E8BA1
MGNVESADGEALPRGPGAAAAPAGPGLLAAGKMPMPEPCELEERFALVLSSMNLPPDKARLLRQYDNEKKWDLICDQERFQVKSPPHAYIQKLQSFLDPGVTRKKFRRRVQESTKVLRELEISLRTNHIGWVREFLNDENKGLDVLVNYLSFAQCAVMFDLEGPDGGEDGALEKLRAWSRSIEDLQHPGALPAPFASSLARAARPSALRYGTLPSRKALKNARLVSQKDDVHLCIMCLRAIMNYQYGFNLVMSHPHAVNEIALSLNNKNPRTKALVLELLAAVCLVRGGHEIILAAFDNFKEVCKEKHRFERLMEYFRNEDSSIDFMVACMQFINIVVHSVEDMNFRVHLQYEFTKLGLEEFLQKSRHTESEKLQVQIQAYLDNVFDVGGLLEDAETKNVALEKVEELEEHLSHLTEKLLDLENENMMRVAELEKQLLQREKELEVVKETYEHTSHQVHTLRRLIKEKDEAFRRRYGTPPPAPPGAEPLPEAEPEALDEDLRLPALPPAPAAPPPPPPPPPLPPPAPPLPGKCPPAPPLPGASPSIALTVGLSAIRIKKPIKTKFRLPVFNWTALKPNQISGTVFSELDDERVLEDLDLERFEELFKTKAQGPALDLVCAKNKASHKAASKVTLLEANRAKNLAITLRKAGRSAEEICRAIHTFDLATLPVDFVECLMRFVPTEAEAKALRQYERERKPLEELADEDRFMLQFSKVERLPQRMAIMAFLGNFAENLQMLTPQLNAIIAASASVKSSQKLKHMLEIILALGNYMNSSKRGAVYGFKLQSLDLLLDTKSTDRKMTLLHFIALTVREKYPELGTFWQELHFVEKAAAVSLENVLLDVKELGRGMELLRRECGLHESGVLRAFLAASEGQLERLQRDARTAEDAYNTVVRYFGESPKTTPPSVFFPVFVRFIRSYKDAEQENETRKKQEEVMREKMLAQEAKKLEKRNKWQQQELIAELRRRQAKDHRPVYEGKDGTIEDIITALKSVPFTARTAKRGSRFFCDPSHHDESNC